MTLDWTSIPGWFSFEALYDDAVARASDGAVFVEVGCFLGKSTAYLGRKIIESGKDIRLYAVDWGFGSPGGEDYHLHVPVLEQYGGNIAGKLVSNLKECGVLDVVTVIAADSVKASKLFRQRSLDFVFIDGRHDQPGVQEDLETWWPLVDEDGIFAGHDYDGCWLGVVEAVDNFFGYDKPNPGDPWTFPLQDKDSPGCWSRKKYYDRDSHHADKNCRTYENCRLIRSHLVQ